MLTNKHVVVALLVAPVLAILAYFLTDAYVGEKPQPARPGDTYHLVERPNCRYSSGRCDLRNGSFMLTLTAAEPTQQGRELLLESAFPLEGVKVSAAISSESLPPPVDMHPSSADGRHWRVVLTPDPGEQGRLYLVVASGGSRYFADAATRFFKNDRRFNRR